MERWEGLDVTPSSVMTLMSLSSPRALHSFSIVLVSVT